MKYFESDFLDFFKSLAANNNRDWFHENKKRYEKSVKNPFKVFVTDLIEAVKKLDSNIDMEAKDAIFRINRDIRFSKDKSPYKLHMSAAVSRGGRKAMDSPGIYVQLDPEFFRIYSGVYQSDKEKLYKVREKIVNEPERFAKLISDKNFVKYFGEVSGEKNKVIPKEFKEAAQEQPLIFNKSFYYFSKLPPETIFEENLMDIILEHYKAATPLNNFFLEV